MVTINNILDAYMAEKNDPNAERKCKNPKSIAYHLKLVRAEWGDMEMADFAKGSKARCREVVKRWRDDLKLSTSTCRKRITHFKAAINHAIDEELIPRELEPVIKTPPQGPPRTRHLSADELERLLACAYKSRTPAHTLLALELYLRTGLRPSSIRDLTWNLVDFEKRIVWFQETEAFEDRSHKRRTNKAMDDELYAILQRAYENRENDDCPYVVTYRGKQCRSVYFSLKQLFKRAGIEGLQVRDLRRSSATFVYNENEGDAKLAATHLGDTEQVTLKHYAQQDPGVTLPAVQTMSAVLQRARARARLRTTI